MTGLKFASDRKWPASRLVVTWLLGVLVAVFLTLVAGDRMRRGLFDSWQASNPRSLKATDVRVVLIDDRSVEVVGPWQWPRYYLARLTEELAARKAKVIAFDILFPEHDRVRPETFVSLYPELSPGAATEIKKLQPMDELFGRVIGSAPVVLAHAGVAAAPAGQAPLSSSPITGKLPHAVDSWPAELAAIPELDDVALGTGVVNARPDSDGVIRTIPLIVSAGGKPKLGFAAEIARNAVGAGRVEISQSTAIIGDHRVPIDRRGRLRLHYGTFPSEHIISAADVLGQSTQIRADEFAGKIVLIGVSAEGTSDIAATPLTAEEYGTLIQAQAVDSILRGDWLQRPEWAIPAEWAAGAILALLALAGARFGRRYPWFLGAAFLSIPVSTWLTNYALGLQLDPARPLLIGGGGLAGVAIGLFAAARVERERLREALIQERISSAESEGELRTARAIQLGMVPSRRELAAIDSRIGVDALLEPAKSVGGDLYDCVRIGPQTIGFAIGDVTGKGVPAALFMAMSKALLSSALCREQGDVRRAANEINQDLMRNNDEVMSVTMIVGQIDVTSGSVSLACAGHEDPYILGVDGSVRRVSLDGGPPFSTVEFDYPVESLTLVKGETLVLVTDGITEAQDTSGTLYGREQILKKLSEDERSPTAICEAIRDDVRRFEGIEDPTDDLTIMAIRFVGAPD